MAGYTACGLLPRFRWLTGTKKRPLDFAIDRALIPFSIRIPKIHAAASLPYLDEEVAKGWQAALENADRD